MNTLMRVANVAKSFGANQVLENISFTLQQGEILGLLGPNGCGKSTLLNLISGFTSLDKGSVEIGGKSVAGLATHQIIDAGIARTFQLPSMPSKRSVTEVVMAGNNQQHSLWDALFRFKSAKALEQETLKKAQSIIKELRLTAVQDLPASALSGGQKKLLGIACALMGSPSVLMLDEPMAGVHPNLRQEIVDTLARLNQSGLSLIIIEHDMHFIQEICHRCIVLNQGDIVADCQPNELSRNRQVLEAYLGGSHSQLAEAV